MTTAGRARRIVFRASAALAASAAVLCLVAILAAPSLAAAPTQLTAAVTPSSVTYPGAAVVSGTVGGADGPLAGAALVLSSRLAGSSEPWVQVGTAVISAADGTYRFPKHAPGVSTEYQVTFTATADQDAAEAVVTLPVRPNVTASFPASLWLGQTALLKGAVAPAHPGGTVVIQRRVSGAWQTLLTVALDSDSRFACDWKPDAFGYYRLRALMEQDVDHAVGASASGMTIVNRPNAHRVPMKYAHYIVIVRHEYRLYYYEHGVLVRAFTVALGRPGFRTPLGYYHIYAKVKPAGGALGACAMFYRHQGGIAIHGTNEPWLLSRPAPRDFSHGCARMYNSQALWLYARCPRGTHIHNLR